MADAPHRAMTPLEYMRIAEMRRQMLAQKAPHVYRVTAGEPVIDGQLAVGTPVIEQPPQSSPMSPQQQAMILEMLRRKAAEAYPQSGALASLGGP